MQCNVYYIQYMGMLSSKVGRTIRTYWDWKTWEFFWPETCSEVKITARENSKHKFVDVLCSEIVHNDEVQTLAHVPLYWPHPHPKLWMLFSIKITEPQSGGWVPEKHPGASTIGSQHLDGNQSLANSGNPAMSPCVAWERQAPITLTN